jgi:hypothetical protein
VLPRNARGLPAGVTHEIGAVDQPAFRSAFSLEDACSSEALMMTYDLIEMTSAMLLLLRRNSATTKPKLASKN